MNTTGNADESSNSTNPSSGGRTAGQSELPLHHENPLPVVAGLLEQHDIESETPNAETTLEQLPAVITLVRYLVFSIPCGDPPKVLHAFNDKDVCKVVRDLHNQNDQQYMFVVRNGELGRLYRTERGFVLRFKEAGLKLKIPFHNRLGPLSDNWIGD